MGIKIIDLNWKNDAMVQLSEKYIPYIGERPRDSIHNYEVDMFYKFSDIQRYPFGDGFSKLQNEINAQSIKFDSVVCMTTQLSFSSNPDFLQPNLYFIFYKGKIVKEYYYDPNNLIFSSKKNPDSDSSELYKTYFNKKNGDDLSLLIFTTIKSNWNFEILKIIINSY